jgi:hypothetical protein
VSTIALLADPGKLVGFLLLADAGAIEHVPSDGLIVKLVPSPAAAVEIHLGAHSKGHWTMTNRGVRHSGICELA